jgi:alpha-tubulin suppressor-like RCC1 family protein
MGSTKDWVKLVAGDMHFCALANDRSLWCWGHGDEGQLGLPLVQRNAPHRIGTAGWRDISAGDHFTCGIHDDGTRQCFGANESGQLGNAAAWQPKFAIVP